MDSVDFDTLFDLEYFFDLSPDLLCIAGYDGYFKKINPAVAKTLGYSYQELFARPINSFVHPDDREITSKNRQSIREGHSLINFENRYVTKGGETVWLSWTSTPVKRDEMVFAIAKVVSHVQDTGSPKRRLFNGLPPGHESETSTATVDETGKLLPVDKIWLGHLEETVKKYIGKIELTNGLLSNDLNISERQLFRRVKSILGVTPNKFVQMMRFKLATEAIATGKYSTLAEISNIAGFDTPAYFNKLFRAIYGINVLEVLPKRK